MNGYGRGEDRGKEKLASVVSRETFGMTLLLFSVILLVISIAGPYMLGEIGVAITAFLMGIFGFFVYPFLALCLYLSLRMITGKKFVSAKWILRGAAILCSVFLIVHLKTSARFLGSGFASYMGGCWHAAESSASASTGGGVVFGIIVYPVQALLSGVGAYILFSLLTALSVFLFLWGTPLRKLIASGKKAPEKKPAPATKKRRVEPAPREQTAPSYEAPAPYSDPYGQPYAQQAYPPQQPYEQPYGQPSYGQPYAPQADPSPQGYGYGGAPARGSAYDDIHGFERYTPPVPQAPEAPTEPKDILFSRDPSSSYRSNLIYNQDSYFNTRKRRSSVEPDESPSRKPEYDGPKFERSAPTYSDSYGAQAETPRPAMPRKVVEQRPQSPADGYSLRDLNYPRTPSYKAPEVDPEADAKRDYYQNDLPVEPEFSSAPNIDDAPFEEADEGELFRSELRRAPREPSPEPIKSEPAPPPREPDRDVFGRNFGEPEGRTRFEEPAERTGFEEPAGRTGFGEPEEARSFGRDELQDDPGLSRVPEGLGRRTDVDLFDDPDPFADEDEPAESRGEEIFRERRGLSSRGADLSSGRGGADLSLGRGGADLPAPKPRRHVYRPYQQPPMSLFHQYDDRISVPQEEIERNSAIIVETLAGFRVDAEVLRVTAGPSVTRYDIDIPKNISVNTVTKRDREIAMRLHARDGVNIYANNEKGTISIEVPNRIRATVGLASVMQSEEYLNGKPGSLMFAIGKDVEGRNVCGNIPKMTHILVAGTTNAGKSVALNAMLISLVCKYSPEDLRLILVDPKKVEFPVYEGLPHLMINEIIADAQKAIMALNWAIKEMERRYDLFEQKTRGGTVVRNIDEYNESRTPDEDKLPKIIIVVDELADLMSVAKKDIEERIQRLTQKARAAGLHLVLATQRPSVDVITGVIKGNLPTRMAVRVIQEVDSRTILDESGAEKLLGAGDMLYKTGGMFNCLRVQGAYISSGEVQAIVENIKANNEAYFDSDVEDYINHTESDGVGGDYDDDDGDGTVTPEYVRALAIVVKLGQASISLIQRKCSVGYNHAGKIMEWMELMGYVSPFDGKAKARSVLLTKEEYEEKYGPLD